MYAIKSVIIGITPSIIDIPREDIGTDAKSAIKIIMVSSKGWTFDSSLFPIILIAKKTTINNINALKKTNSI